ncbi:glycosyltransferase [Brucella sp. TWI432]
MNADRDVAIFIKSLQGGGAERSTVNLANAIAASGTRVDLLVLNDNGVFTKQVSPRVRLIKLKKEPVWRTIWLLRKQPKELVFLLLLLLMPSSPKPAAVIPGLARYLLKNKPTALLTALDYGNVAAVVARSATGVRTRVVLGQRNQMSKDRHRSASWRRRLTIPTLRHFFMQADAIVGVSEGVAEDLKQTLRFPAERVHAIYNAVYNKKLEEQTKEDVDHLWFKDDAIPVIVAVGKLKPQKDYPNLLKAFAKVLESRTARLVILGQGPQLDELKALARELHIEDNVSFEGFVENPFKYLSRASLFVLSSRYEGLPGVLIQALSCGCPVVSTNCPSGPSEILMNGEIGKLVPVEDSDALSIAILNQLDTPHDRDALIARGKFFSEENAVTAYKKVLFDQHVSSTDAFSHLFQANRHVEKTKRNTVEA